MAGVTLRLTEKDIPPGSVIGVINDWHVPHVDKRAAMLAIEVMEYAGVTDVFANGDMADAGPASRHPMKKAQAIFDEGDLKHSVASAMWLWDWIRTRNAIYTLGNHEGWIEKFIASTPEVRGSSVMSLMGLPEDGDGWTVLPNFSRIRYGSRCWEHGNGFFPSGGGGANPWVRIKSRAPDQTTSIGHLHGQSSNFWTTTDDRDVTRTHGAFCIGHMSTLNSHEEYAGSYLNWQQGIEITRVWSDSGKPRFTTDLIEIHRDRRNRPVCEYMGKVFK